MKSYEVNFDGLVGPTHNYGGLSYGNVASQSNSQQCSNPSEAARQGLAKMKALSDMGFKQGVLAPQERPDVAALRRLGFKYVGGQRGNGQPERRHCRWPRAFHCRQPQLQVSPQHRASDHQPRAGGDVRR